MIFTADHFIAKNILVLSLVCFAYVSLALAGARCTLEKQLRNKVIYKFDLEDHFLFARGNACKCLLTSTTNERNANISLATASLTMCG